MNIHVHVASGDDTSALLSALDADLGASGFSPQIAFVFYGCELDDAQLHAYLTSRFPGVLMIR